MRMGLAVRRYQTIDAERPVIGLVAEVTTVIILTIDH